MKKTLFLVFSLLLTVGMANAQKFGHLNSQELLASLVDVTVADTEIEAFQKGLVDKGQQMLAQFEANYKKYVDEANSGDFSKVALQQKEAVLAAEQKKIQEFEIEVQQKIMKKREDLYKPILDKVNGVIKQVGEENGYTLIFDTSMGVLLHFNESEDVTALVKAKL